MSRVWNDGGIASIKGGVHEREIVNSGKGRGRNEIVGGSESVEPVYISSRLRRDAADPITDRPSLAPINYRAAAAHLSAACIRNIVFCPSKFRRRSPPFARKRTEQFLGALKRFCISEKKI